MARYRWALSSSPGCRCQHR
ncbi:MAG: hypothetical protein GDA66_18675 [Nitrospira sp. CR1.2]|nr:hypothetical protein [Nitrospira sp. CR1.2]